MTDPEAIQQDAELGEESPEEGVTDDYQTRLREFDEVDSVPVVSLPVQSSELQQSDLEVEPGGQSG